MEDDEYIGKTGKGILKATKMLGATVAIVSSTITRAGMYYNNEGTESSVGIKAGIDVIMTGVGFFWPIGFGISATYFILDAATDGFGGDGKIQ